MNDLNVFFNPGDIVLLKLDIANKPRMVVIKKITSIFKHDPQKRSEDRKSALRGIKCMWFTLDGFYQEAIFSTKDLELVKSKNY